MVQNSRNMKVVQTLHAWHYNNVGEYDDHKRYYSIHAELLCMKLVLDQIMDTLIETNC